MQGYNCIIVLNQEKDKLLMCRRLSDPYEGLYNLVGGKIEPGEESADAAYRELQEETGIGSAQIELKHLMDFTYYFDKCYVEVYAGRLKGPVTLVEEKHPLVWIDMNEDFFSMAKFAGEGNIGHMLEILKQCGEDYL